MQAAQRMDILSFGQLCFWILFQDQLWSDAEPIDEAHDLGRRKAEDTSFANFAEGSRTRVMLLITLPLTNNPEDRVHSFKELMQALKVPM